MANNLMAVPLGVPGDQILRNTTSNLRLQIHDTSCSTHISIDKIRFDMLNGICGTCTLKRYTNTITCSRAITQVRCSGTRRVRKKRNWSPPVESNCWWCDEQAL